MSDSEKDRRTLEAMGQIYCKAHHEGVEKDASGLCEECRGVVEATLARTAVCPFEHEGNCQDCSLHCQRGEAQQKIKALMSYAAPRMFVRHPLMALEYVRKKFVKTS